MNKPDAWMHIQGDHAVPSDRPLDDDERARGWTERPLVYGEPVEAALHESRVRIESMQRLISTRAEVQDGLEKTIDLLMVSVMRYLCLREEMAAGRVKVVWGAAFSDTSDELDNALDVRRAQNRKKAK